MPPDPLDSENPSGVLDLLDRLVDQLREYPHATVLIWAKQFISDGDPYTYVALKAGDGRRGSWYLTGRETKGWQSAQLAAELSGPGIGQIHIATGWERLK